MLPETPSPAESAKIALAIELLDRCGEIKMRATGSSMLPSLWPGDVLSIRRRLMNDVRPGDIALFTRDGRLFAHRVVAHDGVHLLTQGDAVPSPDAPVSGSELLGVAVSVSRDGKRVGSPARLSIPGRLLASLVRRSSRASRILQRVHRLSRMRSATVTLNAEPAWFDKLTMSAHPKPLDSSLTLSWSKGERLGGFFPQ
jgi:hypothetical protein